MKKKRKSKNDPPEVKTVKLTDTVLSKLSTYFKKAVLDNPDSLPDMKNAILATFYHKSSTDEKPQHQHCPDGADSWCGYRKAEATNKLIEFKHPPAFDQETQDMLERIYEELTEDDKLEKCLGANTQNNNESYNSCVWSIAPKHKFVAKQTLEIAAHCAACVFNEGLLPILKIMEVMGVKIGTKARQYVEIVNEKRTDRAELEATEASKEHRTFMRNAKVLENDVYKREEGVVYEDGMEI